jgi:acetoin utilization deacetylase AcuC-like enzyme
MGARLWDDLGLDGITLQLNTLGQAAERASHRAELIAISSGTAKRSTKRAGGACTAIRYASSTARTRSCTTSSSVHHD